MATPHLDRLTQPRRQAERTYDRLSRWYDILADTSEKEVRNLGLRMLAVQSGEDVLEIGLGTGHGVVALGRSAGSTGMTVGIDVAWRMLKKAQSRVSRAGLADRIYLVRSDAGRTPFRDACFDAVFMSFVLELFGEQEMPVVLGQCHRVLRSAGRICAVSLSRTPSPGLVERVYDWSHRRFPTWIDCRPIDVKESLERAGFVTVDSVRVATWGLPVAVVVARKP